MERYATVAVLTCLFVTPALALDAKSIGSIVGVEATTASDGVVRVALPRNDVDVHVNGVPLAPFAGLTSWAAFTEAGDHVMVMGDTVVFQDEADAAMDAAFARGLSVTALHNHFFYDEPPVYFMHIGGEGSAEALAGGVRAIWDAIKGVREETPRPSGKFRGPTPTPGEISPEPLEAILGMSAATHGGMVKFSSGREGRMNGTTIGGSMGLSTWAAFTGTDEWAAVDGDFIMTAGEVQPVLHALRAAGIHVVALHNHMMMEEPAFYFTHFWGEGTPAALARGLKSALDAQQSASAH